MGKWKELAQPDDIHTCHADCQNPICVAVREAYEAGRKDENEACAKVCEAECIGFANDDEQLNRIAAAIRARMEP